MGNKEQIEKHLFKEYFKRESIKSLSELERNILDHENAKFYNCLQFIKVVYGYGKETTIVYMTERGVWNIAYGEGRGGFYKREELVYRWDKFRITEFFYYDMGEIPEQFFNFFLEVGGRKMNFTNMLKEEMYNTIYKNCIVVNKHRLLFKTLLNDYLKVLNVPEIKVCFFFGFDAKRGWVLPDPNAKNKYQIVTGSTIHNAISKSIERNMFNSNHDAKLKKVPELMKTYYDCTGIEHKDCIFAWCVGSVFYDAIKIMMTGISPHIYLEGKGSTGKTKIIDSLVMRAWGYWDDAIGDEAKHDAHIGELCSASTFAVLIDECEHLRSEDADKLKRSATGSPVHMRLKNDGKIRVKAQYHSPIVGTYNFNRPVIFNDSAYKTRCGIFYHENTEKIEGWTEAYQDLEQGLIGRYIYEKTKNWKFRKIKKIMEIQSDHDLTKKDDRLGNIVKMFEFGAYLCKRIFKLELDLSELDEILESTPGKGNEEVPSLIKSQIEQALQFEADYNPNVKSWVKKGMIQHGYHGMDGIIYTNENAIDLYRFSKNESIRSLTSLKDILGCFWKPIDDLVISTFTKKGKSTYGLFIPEKFYPDMISGVQILKSSSSHPEQLELTTIHK